MWIGHHRDTHCTRKKEVMAPHTLSYLINDDGSLCMRWTTLGTATDADECSTSIVTLLLPWRCDESVILYKHFKCHCRHGNSPRNPLPCRRIQKQTLHCLSHTKQHKLNVKMHIQNVSHECIIKTSINVHKEE